MKDLLKKLSNKESLGEEETFRLFELMMNSNKECVTDAQIGAYLMGTSSRIISTDELVGAARSLRSHMVAVDHSGLESELLDTCGTGGSGLNSFNTSTVVSFIAAAAGQPVAKHGNRAQTSKSGSADLLSALGVNIELTPEQLNSCLTKAGFCFMFAPLHHPATKRVQIIRRELGFRTIFNFLGPLANPAGATRQLLGVSSKEMLPVMAEALLRLGTEHALVVCGEDGLDEITLSGETHVCEVHEDKVTSYSISPDEFNFLPAPLSEIQGFPPEESAKKVYTLLHGEKGPLRELIVLNAGAALYASGKAESIADGVSRAEILIDSGKALQQLERIIEVSNSLG